MEIITLDNYKEFHAKLIGLGFNYVNFPSINMEDYFILLQDNGKTRFRLGICIQNERFHKSIVLTVRKYRRF